MPCVLLGEELGEAEEGDDYTEALGEDEEHKEEAGERGGQSAVERDAEHHSHPAAVGSAKTVHQGSGNQTSDAPAE